MYALYFKGTEILPIPELLAVVEPKTLSYIITDLRMLYSHIPSHKWEEESLGETCWHMFPCLSLKHAVQGGGREFFNESALHFE